MNKKSHIKNKLSVQLICAVIISLVISIGAYFTIRYFAFNEVYAIIQSESFNAVQTQKALKRLDEFIVKNDVSLKDLSPVDKWCSKEQYIYIVFYKNGSAIYDSAFGSHGFSPYNDENPDIDSLPTLTIDGEPVKIASYCFYGDRFYDVANAGCGILGFVLFVISLTIMIHKKLKYIELLESELMILAGGELNYPITIKGRDELSDLAVNIDSMRISILERQAGEDLAKKANSELITAISHDLRTPLTSLLGFLDLISLKKYKDSAQLDHFLLSAHEKAYQIKEMSDKLFEYFYVYSTDWEIKKLEITDATDFVCSVFEDEKFTLESKGFSVSSSIDSFSGYVNLDFNIIRRVFDNVLSNIIKYAENSAPIRMMAYSDNLNLIIEFHNSIKPSACNIESTKIGLKTCEKALLYHKGSFTWKENENLFSVRLQIPIHL
ncbi:MAG: HAMP domain-containing sensor histidine kinase [Oscillospiraceae bacterium]